MDPFILYLYNYKRKEPGQHLHTFDCSIMYRKTMERKTMLLHFEGHWHLQSRGCLEDGTSDANDFVGNTGSSVFLGFSPY